MVAVAHLPPARHDRLGVVRSAPSPPPVQPGRLPRTTYRRRRAAAAGVAAAVLLTLSIALQGLLGAFGAGSVTVPHGPREAEAMHVVQPGDTFWDLAQMVRPDEDPRPLVARLVAAHGSSVLRVGERISLRAGG